MDSVGGTGMTELSRLLKQSIDMAKSKSEKPKIDFVDGSRAVLSREQIDQHHRLILERLKTFREAHDTLEFGSEVRNEWLLLAFQELVRDAMPFIAGIGSQVSGAQKEICDEWLSVFARIMRKGAAE